MQWQPADNQGSGRARALGASLHREFVAQPLQEALAHRAYVPIFDGPRNTAQHLLLFRGEKARDFDDHLHELVAPALSVAVGHAPPRQPQHGPALCAAGNRQACGSSQCRHLDLGAEGRLREADRYSAAEVVAPPCEERVLLHFNLNTQIAARVTNVGKLALTCHRDPFTVANALWYDNRQMRDAGHFTSSAAARAGIIDIVASSVTNGAGFYLPEVAACRHDLSSALAVGAKRSARPTACACAVT